MVFQYGKNVIERYEGRHLVDFLWPKGVLPSLCPGMDLSNFLGCCGNCLDLPATYPYFMWPNWLFWCMLTLLPFHPNRAHAWATKTRSGGHPIQAGDGALGASRLQRDTLPQLQPDRPVPLQGWRQGGDPGGGVLWHPEPSPSAHHPQLDALHQPERQAGATQSRGGHGEQRAGRSDWWGW